MTREQALEAALASINPAYVPRVETRTAAQQADLEQWQAERDAWAERQERAQSRREARAETFGNAWRHDL